MIDWLIALLLAIVSPAQAQNTETFQNYMSSRASAGTINGLNQLLIMQNNQVKLGSVQALGGVLITSGITRAAIATSRIGGNIIVVSGNLVAGDIGANAIYINAGCTVGGLRAIADATGQFWCLTLPLGLAAPVGWFGAVCDGTTDDKVAIQLALTTASNGQTPIVINGSCAIGSALSITGALSFGGFNNQNDRLVAKTTGFNAININVVGPVVLHDFNITGATGNAAEAIDVTATGSQNNNSRFNDLDITGWNTGIHFVSATGWEVNQTRIEGVPPGGIGIVIENQFAIDNGDNGIVASDLQCGAGAPAILWKSGGGLAITGSKFLGNACSSSVEFALANGAATSDIFIANNSMESATTATGVGILLHRAGSTGSLFSVTIANNEMVGGTLVSVPNDVNGAWLHQFSVIGNALGSLGASNVTPANATALVAIDSATQVAVAYNVMGSTVTKDRPTVIGTGVNFAIVGPNICAVGTNACSTSISSGQNTTTFAPF